MSIEILEKYGSFSSAFNNGDGEKKLPVSEKQIIYSIKNAYKNTNENKKQKDKIEVELEPRNIARVTIGQKTKQIKYYKNRQQKKDTPPWFGISKSPLDKLMDPLNPSSIKEYILLFWEKQDKGVNAPTFSYIGKISEIKEKWSENVERYLLNFKLETNENNENVYKSDNDKIIDDNERIILKKHSKGTSMSKESEE